MDEQAPSVSKMISSAGHSGDPLSGASLTTLSAGIAPSNAEISKVTSERLYRSYERIVSFSETPFDTRSNLQCVKTCHCWREQVHSIPARI